MTSKSGQTRASGLSQAEEITKEVAEEQDKPLDIEGPEGPEPKRDLFRTPGFSRMRMEWDPESRRIITTMQTTVEERVVLQFRDAYETMNALYEVVRTPSHTDEHGHPARDRFGFVIWKRLPNGDWDEDWSRLTRREKEDFLFRITTRLFDWEQRAQDAWGEAMMARAQWEERFSIDYDGPIKGTIEDRTAKARIGAAPERYFAIYATLFSRRAESVVKVMNNLALRLKDSLTW